MFKQTRLYFETTASFGDGGPGSGSLLLLVAVLVYACNPAPSGPPALTADNPLHLEEHLEDATIEGSVVPDTEVVVVEWDFAPPEHGWRPVATSGAQAVEMVSIDGGVRLPLSRANPQSQNSEVLEGYIFTDLADLRFEDWSQVEITARANGIRSMGLFYNYSEDDPAYPNDIPFYSNGGKIGVASDGAVQTYRVPLESPNRRRWEGPWTHLGLWFNTPIGASSAAIELLAIRLVSAEGEYAAQSAGVRLVGRSEKSDSKSLPTRRRSLFLHTPGTVSYRVKVPREGRLDVGLGILSDKAPITFSVSARSVGSGADSLLVEVVDDPSGWAQHSIDLAHFEGDTITLDLTVDSDRAGSVAFWAAPTLSGTRVSAQPNVILYIIDGGGADYMSLYDYPRSTTPNLARLAAEGAVFEKAHSNSSWTRPSTASFLTSLQHSALGGLVNQRNPVPEQVLTMAEHMHQAGYQTAAFTSNANAGSMSGLDRGNDVFREAGMGNYSTSSSDLHANFWAWRSAYPGEPYSVHFQTTDVHNPHTPTAPFAGLFIDPDRRRLADDWTAQVEEIPETDDVRIGEALDQIGADRVEYWTSQRDLHDECMAHQDQQLGELITRLKAHGEWERTLLIVAADHSVAAGSWDYNLLMRSPAPPHVYHDDWATPILRPGISRIPLLVVWPGHIAAGHRFREPVSLIDLLPTVLDLTGLPYPEAMQGQSLAPLLLGEAGWERQPIFLDEFEVDSETGKFRGRIEVIDGRWGASLLINEDSDSHERWRRPTPLLLYDLWEDPDCLRSLHEERPDLVEKYTRLLDLQYQAHRDLGKLFDAGEESPLTPEQIESLQSLGYIQ